MSPAPFYGPQKRPLGNVDAHYTIAPEYDARYRMSGSKLGYYASYYDSRTAIVSRRTFATIIRVITARGT